MTLAVKRAIGLMSGTSGDGVDAALIETDGVHIKSLGPYHFVDYSQAERAEILAAMRAVKAAAGPAERERFGAALTPLVTERHAMAVRALMAAAGLGASDVDVIGFHGQTLFHDPASAYTLQIGDAGWLAGAIGVPVVHQFRRPDMAAGGEGAPLVPVYHAALVGMAGLELPVAVVNIGGVANVTFINHVGIDSVGVGVGGAAGRGGVGRSPADDGGLLAFDTGPGNVLIDEWVGAKTGERFDDRGQLAAAGRVNEAALAEMMANPYLSELPPKSLDRYDFSYQAIEGLSLEDGAATLVELTARAIAGARGVMASPPKSWVIVGGGHKNEHMMARLKALLGVPVFDGTAFGWSPGYVEAEAFGFLAVRHLAGLPLTFPGTTGVKAPVCGGELVLPA